MATIHPVPPFLPGVAHRVERGAEDAEVAGAIPAPGTKGGYRHGKASEAGNDDSAAEAGAV